MLRVHFPSILMNYWIKFTNTFNIIVKIGTWNTCCFYFLPVYNPYVGKLNLCEKLIESVKDEEFIVLFPSVFKLFSNKSPTFFLNIMMMFFYYPKVPSAYRLFMFSTKILFIPPSKPENDQNAITLLIGPHYTIKWKGLA